MRLSRLVQPFFLLPLSGLLVTAILQPARAQYTFAPLVYFNGTDGAYPYGSLIFGPNGDLYGTTSGGGIDGDGTLFKLDPTSGTLNSVVSFTGSNPSIPSSDLLYTGGEFYGTTQTGGSKGDGTVFEWNGTSSTVTTLVTFTGKSGADPGSTPLGNLIDVNGNFYGTTLLGGAKNVGTVFEVNGTTHAFTSKVAFTGTTGADPGSDPAASLIDYNGNLYGTGEGTGSGTSLGNLFDLNETTNVYTNLVTFTSPNGTFPVTTPLNINGILYGTTAQNTSTDGAGTIYSYDIATKTFTSLFSFNGTSASDPTGALITDGLGNLFGTSQKGGADSNGSVFEYNIASGQLTNLFTFDGADGTDPLGALLMDSKGDLFGTTSGDGNINEGSIFELVASTPEPSSNVTIGVGVLFLMALALRTRKRQAN